ncbi:MAG: hypothetical protein JW801_15775 [Bacteroidales bacterium]|nr:hypothetical protein [Bacteroidales bacterium]
MNYSGLVQQISAAVKKAQEGQAKREIIFSNHDASGKHEFLFFIKPEICMKSEFIALNEILEMILSKIDSFSLQVKNAILLPAPYLEKHSVIAQHYGVINAIARDAKNNLNPNAIARFEELFKQSFKKAVIYGGLEFLKVYPSLTATGLDYLWQNSGTEKLGGGAYAQALKLDGEQVYLVNGFHPRQLEHFIMPGRSIVALTLTGDLDWGIARNQFIGKTNPADAGQGSIRSTLLAGREKFGLQAVNSSWNGVHLSAGPVEGLVELIRYNSDFESGFPLSYDDFQFGKELLDNFNPDIADKIISNVTADYKGKSESIFDLTEEKNAEEALEILREVFSKQ